MNNLNLPALCKDVIKVVEEAASFISAESKNFDTGRIEYKGAKDMVSYVDKETEKILVKKFSGMLPEVGFITEEGTIAQADTSYKWIIDPLDGTTNFLHGLPPYSISVALAHGQEIILGVVYEVVSKECFYAWKGGGAFLNNKKIEVSQISRLENSLIVTGFPYDLLDKSDIYFKIIQEFVERTHGVRRLGSAAVDLCYVACGRFDAYFEFNLKIWDIAAGLLIVKEAGGVICDFEGGDDYLYGRQLLASGNIKKETLQVIQKHWV